MLQLRPYGALFLDRDGVINVNRTGHVLERQQFEFLPGVLGALCVLARRCPMIVVVTNQGAVGRGLLSPSGLDEIHIHMLSSVRAAGGRIDAVYCCTHAPEAGCICRKPMPGLLMRAARDLHFDLGSSILVGDALSDIDAAHKAGASAAFVLSGRDCGRVCDLPANTPVYRDLADFVRCVR